ncbi:MAG TPA: hypothetical protein VNN72_26695 [Polyangiaceae bacterium]|nr:hypothetical protein [Polyangiaceae bacterium]
MTQSRGRILVCIGLAACGLAGCGRSSRNSGTSAAGGHAGAEAAAAGGDVSQGGSPAGGDGGRGVPLAGGGGDGPGATGGESGSGGTFTNGGMGGEGIAGNAVAGGGRAGSSTAAGMAGSSSGQGGLAGAPAGEPGVVCGAYDHTLPDVECTPGQICVRCAETETTASVRCAPNPTSHAVEYDAFLATCTDSVLLTECDGPEDCPFGTRCQLRTADYAFARCAPEPPNCTAYCVACNSSADCDNGQSCVPNEQGARGWLGKTCGPALNELLPSGDWLIGWSGGLNHYSWFRFTPGSGTPNQGTVRTVPVTCAGCEALDCAADGGTYEIVDEEVTLAFPDSCSLSFRLGQLASPSEPSVGGGEEASVSARVYTGVELGPSYEAVLYSPGVACDADFTTCSFPPP